MQDEATFIAYVGTAYNGIIMYLTDEDGTTEHGMEAQAFSVDEAYEIAERLRDKGMSNVVVVEVPNNNVHPHNPVLPLALNDLAIETLVRMGFKKWVRGTLYRLYYNDTKWNTRNPLYVDCVTGIVRGGTKDIRVRVQECVDRVAQEYH